MDRDRTEVFKKSREEYRAASVGRYMPREGVSHEVFTTEDRLLEGSSGEVTVVMALPPKWMNVIDEIKRDTALIEKYIKELDDLHKSHLLVGFGDDEKDEQKIQILTAEITKKFQENNKRLKQLAPPKDKQMAREDVMKKNVRATLAKQLNQLSFDFRRKQKEYLQKRRGRQETGDSDLFAVEKTDSLAEDLYDRGFTQAQMEIVATAQQRQQERSKEIQEILQSITELSEVMEDLRVLVVDQGTILDRIDYNIEQVDTLMNESLKEVVQAVESQKSSRMRTCMLGLCVAIMVLCMALIGKFLWQQAGS